MTAGAQITEFGGVTMIKLSTARTRAAKLHAYCFLWDRVLIDSAFPFACQHLLQALCGRPPAYVLHTHLHEDHCGNSRAIQEQFGAAAIAPADLAEQLAHPERERYGLYRRVIWGAPAAPICAEPPIDGTLDVGSNRFRFVPTPGHLPVHYAIFEQQTGYVFTGDLFISRRPRYAKSDEVAALSIRSLRELAKLKPAVMFDAHIGAVSDPAPRLLAKADFLEDLRQQAKRLAAHGLSVRAITRKLLGREGLMSYATAGDYTKANMIRSLLMPGNV